MATILVVDDDADACDAIKQALDRAGYEVHTAQSIERGVELLQRRKGAQSPPLPKYAMAIVDLRFENSKGGDIETAGMRVVEEALRAPGVGVIVLTGHSSLETAAKSIEFGVLRYIMKGESEAGKDFMGTLVGAVTDAIGSRSDALRKDILKVLRKEIRDQINAEPPRPTEWYRRFLQKVIMVLEAFGRLLGS